MAKVQIVADAVQTGEVRAIDEWFARWRGRLTAVSDDLGCGCCVHIWEIEGPAEALRELPDTVIAFPGIEE